MFINDHNEAKWILKHDLNYINSSSMIAEIKLVYIMNEINEWKIVTLKFSKWLAIY